MIGLITVTGRVIQNIMENSVMWFSALFSKPRKVAVQKSDGNSLFKLLSNFLKPSQKNTGKKIPKKLSKGLSKTGDPKENKVTKCAIKALNNNMTNTKEKLKQQETNSKDETKKIPSAKALAFVTSQKNNETIKAEAKEKKLIQTKSKEEIANKIKRLKKRALLREQIQRKKEKIEKLKQQTEEAKEKLKDKKTINPKRIESIPLNPITLPKKDLYEQASATKQQQQIIKNIIDEHVSVNDSSKKIGLEYKVLLRKLLTIWKTIEDFQLKFKDEQKAFSILSTFETMFKYKKTREIFKAFYHSNALQKISKKKNIYVITIPCSPDILTRNVIKRILKKVNSIMQKELIKEANKTKTATKINKNGKKVTYILQLPHNKSKDCKFIDYLPGFAKKMRIDSDKLKPFFEKFQDEANGKKVKSPVKNMGDFLTYLADNYKPTN